MTRREVILLLVSVLASVTGQFFLKIGALKLGKFNIASAFQQILSILTTPELLLGLMCYGLGAIAYILLLTRVKLSVAGPAASLVYVFSVGLGYFFFQESIPFIRVVGLALIVAGVILVVWKK